MEGIVCSTELQLILLGQLPNPSPFISRIAALILFFKRAHAHIDALYVSYVIDALTVNGFRWLWLG